MLNILVDFIKESIILFNDKKFHSIDLLVEYLKMLNLVIGDKICMPLIKENLTIIEGKMKSLIY